MKGIAGSVILRIILLIFLLCPALAEESVLVVFTEPKSEIFSAENVSLGSSGQPFRIDLKESSDVTFIFKADGYPAQERTFSASELLKTKRIPAQGVLKLEKGGRGAMLVAALVLVQLVGIVGLVLKTRNKPQVEEQATFKKGEFIGEGATAKVFAASSSKYLGRELALKILKAEHAQESTAKGRLLRSLEQTLKLKHPNLIELFESGENEDGLPYILMERLRGKALVDSMVKGQALSAERILEIMKPLCSVLQYLHQNSVVHRDVKPENIFMTDGGALKLLDLEISRTKDCDDLTQTGVVIGTPLYLAPEQIQGQLTPQSDQYALGVILFEMLTGRPPFDDEDSLKIIHKHLRQAPPSVRALNPEVTSLQEAVVNKMLAKQPSHRFSDLHEAIEALEEALTSGADDEQTATSI